MLFDSSIWYPAAMIAGGLFLLSVLRIFFTRAERVRKSRVGDLTQFVAVRTESPELNQAVESRERALESIETRFSIIRRLTTPIILILTFTLAIIPFLSEIPQAVVTLLITVGAAIVGIASKPVLENAIAGVMISFGQPIRIGDLVKIKDYYGLIEEINLTHTVVKVWDWRRVVIPNSRLLQMEYLNYTLIDRWQWSYLSFWVSADVDIDLVQELAIAAVESSDHSVKVKPPGFWVIEMNKEGVVCWVAGWVAHPLEAWALRHDIARSLLRSFKEHGIKAHMYQHEVQPGFDGRTGGTTPAPQPEPPPSPQG